MVKISIYRPDRPWGLRVVEAPRIFDSRHMKVGRLSVLPTGRLYTPGTISGTHFCWRVPMAPTKILILFKPLCFNARHQLFLWTDATGFATYCNKHYLLIKNLQHLYNYTAHGAETATRLLKWEWLQLPEKCSAYFHRNSPLIVMPHRPPQLKFFSNLYLRQR